MKARLYFETRANRDKARDDVEADLSSKNAKNKKVTVLDSHPIEGIVNLLIVDASLDDDENGKGSYDKLAKILKDKQVLKGEVSSHDCTHGDPIILPCDKSNYVVDRK